MSHLSQVGDKIQIGSGSWDEADLVGDAGLAINVVFDGFIAPNISSERDPIFWLCMAEEFFQLLDICTAAGRLLQLW